MPIVLKSGNLNLLEPSGPVQACNGIALPFFYSMSVKLGFSNSVGKAKAEGVEEYDAEQNM